MRGVKRRIRFRKYETIVTLWSGPGSDAADVVFAGQRGSVLIGQYLDRITHREASALDHLGMHTQLDVII